MSETDDRLIKSPDAANLLGKHVQELSDWRHQGRGPKYVKLGRSVRYRLSDLYEYMSENTVEPTPRSVAS